ncbi:MAG: Gfo/Idh/MocA family protein, partial [Planctomycetota bacterium]
MPSYAQNHYPTRRTFIRHVATAGAVLPATLPALTRAASPNAIIRIASVGTQRRANANISASAKTGLARFTAFADVDAKHLDIALKAHRGSKGFTDYRRMLAEHHSEFDAVIVATPDHHHVHAAVPAMQLGKHVYCEKPLAHTVREVRLMKETARRNGVVTQMGNQMHSGLNYQVVVDKIRAGIIGRVSEVHCFIYGAMNQGGAFKPQPDPVPQHLDWDLWLGPAATRPYYENLYHVRHWRGWWDFGGGGLADFCCHYMDLPFWALGLTHPHTVRADGPEPLPLRTSRQTMAEYHFAATAKHPDLKITWHLGGTHIDKVNIFEKYGFTNQQWKGAGVLFKGDKGVLISGYKNHLILSEGKTITPTRDKADPIDFTNESVAHHRQWHLGITEGLPTGSNFD